MGIKKIKKENDLINISLIDLLGKLDNSDTKKYTQFLVKILRKNYNEDMKYPFKESSNREMKLDEILNINTFDGWVTRRLITLLYGWDEIHLFVDFCDYMERGLTNEKDISKYDSWDMVANEVYQAKNRHLFKKAKKEVKVVYEDDQYLCIKPLTYAASVSYGYQTRWCTASVSDKSYFYNHSRDGILIYVIDKINNNKFGFYHNQHQIQIYNQKDDRVDSIETGLPFELLNRLVGEMKSDAKDENFNYKLFSESELKEMGIYRHEEPIPVPMEEMMMEEPMTENEMTEEIQTRMVDIDHHLASIRERIIITGGERGRLRPINPLGDDLP